MTLALFDFDGTLTTHETMPAFVRRSTPRWRKAAGMAALAPVIAGYRMGLVSGTAVRRAVVAVAYRGMCAHALDAAGRAFAHDHLPGALRPDAMRRLAWHQAQGHEVVVVSGGLDVYLAPWCEAHGLALLCSRLEQRDGRLTGRYAGAQCAGAEKAARVRAHCDLAAHGTVYAYGDTVEDDDMLALADLAWYRGRPRLQAGAPR